MNKITVVTFALLIAILTAMIIVGITPIAFAAPVLNPENGNYYEYFEYGYDWNYIRSTAEIYTHDNTYGNMVTITSQSENDFVANLIPEDRYAWLGLTDQTTEGTYTWVNGETYDYTNWEQHQPNNRYGTEDYIEMSGDTGKWNDRTNSSNDQTGYIIEFTAPPTAQNPENGHYYQYIRNIDASWTEAENLAETSIYNDIYGHLVTITSESENDFVTDLIPENNYAWIGLTDKDTEGIYTWVNGETSNYTNWDSGQPDNKYGGEHYTEISKSTGKWDDSRNNHEFITGYVVEYSSPVLNPENGHYYEFIKTRATWDDAKIAAENSTHNGVSGHLVTLTSESESDFMDRVLPHNLREYVWIGLDNRIATEEYKWVTGEPFDYSNWWNGAPQYNSGFGLLSKDDNQWFTASINSDSSTYAYIIEYDTPDT